MKIAATILLSICSILALKAQSRIEVPGSRATILIPEGTIISPHYSAMTKPDVFEMSIVEFQGNLESKFREIDSAGYVQRGIKVYAEYEMEVDGYKGKVIHGYSNPTADVVQFLFGDSTFFVMASTMYTRGDNNLHNEILGYYKSINIEKSKSINWNKFIAIKHNENSPFKLDTEFINPMSIIYKNESDFSESYIMVQQYPNLEMFPNVETFLSHTLSNTVFQSYEIDQFLYEGKTKLNGKSVYEFSSYCINNKGEQHLIHCTARLTDELATIVCAVVTTKNDEKEVKKFFQSMEFKN